MRYCKRKRCPICRTNITSTVPNNNDLVEEEEVV